jgi:F-type H+-transporting ATPase subunit b
MKNIKLVTRTSEPTLYDEDPHAEVDTHEEVGHGAEATEGGVASSLGLNGQLFAFQLLNFAIVGAIIWFLILKPLTSKMEERKKMIDESIDNAKKVDANLQMSEQKFQEKVDEAKVEANKIIEKSHTEASKLSEEMKEKASKDIELLVNQAKRNIKIEKEDMISGLKKETANLVVLAVEKILNEKLDAKKDQKLIEDAIDQLKK